MVINFGTGPAKIPEQVLLDAQKELIDYNGTGMSITEISHRTEPYNEIHQRAINNLREILEVPENFEILFTHGGGNGMFSAACLNLIGKTGNADYIVTGYWSRRAADEAKLFGNVNLVVPESTEYTSIPSVNTWKLDPNASFVFYCDNETVNGLEFDFVPETNNIPLVCDMSSNFLTTKINFEKYGVIFAAAHKGVGTAGVTVVIVRKDLIGYALKATPSILNFKVLSENNSIYNTPGIFAVYIMCKALDWIKSNGGIDQMNINSRKKSKMVYDVLDEFSDFYICLVDKKYRSHTSLPFRIGSKTGDIDLENKFLDAAKKNGMLQLNGHMTVGGIRVSLYNGITIEEVEKLVVFMRTFYVICKNK